MGAWVLFAGGRRGPLMRRLARQPVRPIDEAARTAIVMPICNEHVPTVFGGLRATSIRSSPPARRRSFDFFVLSDTNDPDIRAAEQAAWSALSERLAASGGRRGAARRAPALPLAPAPHQAQGRQRRRLLPPLGPRLPLLGRARRRQRDDRRVPDDAGAADGGAPRRRHHPDRAARRRPRDLPRPRPAVLRPRLRAALHRRHAFLAARRIALLGPQRDPAHGAVHRRTARCAPIAGQGLARRARSSRTTSSRRR